MNDSPLTAGSLDRIRSFVDDGIGLNQHDAARLLAYCDHLSLLADRYRWLRGDSCGDHSPRWTQWEIRCWRAPQWTADLRRAELDAAIDAARAGDSARTALDDLHQMDHEDSKT